MSKATLDVPAKTEEKISPLLKLVLELGPLVVFFFANSRGEWLAGHFPALAELGGPIFIATGLFMAATAAALAVSWVLTRTLPICKSDAQQRLRAGDRFRRHVDVSGSVDVVWGARRGKVGGGGGPGPTTPVRPTGDRGGRD